jgi:hypothetical protein
LKRLEAGENVFRRLEENANVIDALIVHAAKQRNVNARANQGPYGVTKQSSAAVAKRKKVNQQSATADCNTSSPTVCIAPSPTATEAATSSLEPSAGTGIHKQKANADTAVDAAAALCQLSSLGAWDKEKFAQGEAIQYSC